MKKETKKKSFKVDYYRQGEVTHSYEEMWEPSNIHCPHCGEASVWKEVGTGDFYYDVTHLCITCASEFTIQLGESNNQTKQRVAAIKRPSYEN